MLELAIWDHFILWGAFFITGIAFGFLLGYPIVTAGKGKRL